jgi:cytochrome P450
MEEGTRRYPDQPFVLPLLDRTVILPHRVINEVKSLPESQVSINANNYRRFLGKYTLMGTKSDEFVAAIKQDLTRQVGNLMGELTEETEYADSTTIEGKQKTLPVYPTMLKFITLLSGRTLVGLPLSRRDEWLQSSINYAVESVRAGAQLREYPARLRWLVAFFLPRIYRVKEHQVRVREMLHPILARQRQEEGGNKQQDEQEGRLVRWLLHHYKSPSAVPVEVLGKDHLLAFFAAIHIATNALTHVVLDLAARPEYMAPLREEMEAELGSTADGRLTLAGLAKMRKMDSFVKESLRASPPGGIGMLWLEARCSATHC